MRVTVAALALMGALSSHAAPSLHIEPPHWWVGFKETRLQLMVEGEGLSATRPLIEGAKLLKVTRSDSPHHLWLDLETPATPGAMQLRFERDGATPLEARYELKARAAGSAERQGFGPKDAIYLIVPDRFAKGGSGSGQGLREAGEDRSQPGARHGGDLAGMTQHLDYIAGLGFTQIWPTPLSINDSKAYSYHGYAATDFYRIDPRFGSHADYLGFAAAAKTKGVGLIQDIVLNHIGSHHRWMGRPPAKDWINHWPQYTETHHARVSLQDPNAAPSDRERFASGWFSRGMPDLNQRNPQLATYLTQMSLWWVEEAGLSGIRTDTYSYSDRAFLTQWSERLMREYPQLNIVGEEWSPHPAIVSYWQRGKKNHDGYVSHTPSLMDFPLQGALLAALSEADGHDSGFTKLYEALAHDFVYADPTQLVLFVGNHDTPRLYSLLKEDLALTTMATNYLAFTRRIPQWFYGDELLLTSPRERDDGRVRADFPGGWAGDAVDGFSDKGLSEAQRGFQSHVRRLFNWRKGERLVHEGKLMHYAPAQGQYVLFRYAEGDKRRLMLVLNKNSQDGELELGRFPEMLDGYSEARDALSGQALKLDGRKLALPARSAWIVEFRRP
jgi:glycosidase